MQSVLCRSIRHTHGVLTKYQTRVRGIGISISLEQLTRSFEKKININTYADGDLNIVDLRTEI